MAIGIDRTPILENIKHLYHSHLLYKMKMEKTTRELRKAVWAYIEAAQYPDHITAAKLGIDVAWLPAIRDGKRIISHDLLEKLERL